MRGTLGGCVQKWTIVTATPCIVQRGGFWWGGIMGETFQQQAALRAPVCPNCNLPMRYQTSEVDQQDGKVRHVMFVCSCGLTSDQMMAAPD
jgi:hypothetical protein